MKFFIALSTLFIAATSFAQTQRELPPAPIYRHGKVKVRIYKSKMERTGDSYAPVIEEICKKQVPVEVWDIRNPQGQWGSSNVTCETTMGGKKISATAIFQLTVVNFETDVTGQHSPAFLSAGGLYTAATDSQQQGPITTNFSYVTMSRDLNINSLINTVGESQHVVCMTHDEPGNLPGNAGHKSSSDDNCQVFNPEVINATIEFIGE